jgi:hypothetical protein
VIPVMNEPTRVTVTLKLIPGKDDDLIRWWQSSAPGRRNKLLKQVMRAYVSGVSSGETEQQQLSRIADDTAWLRAALTEMPTHLAQIVAHLGAAAAETRPAAPQQGQEDALSNEAVQRREKRIARTTW